MIMPVYKAFATERLAPELKTGNTIYRTYGSDVIVNEMGGDGSYSTQALTDTDESLVVNQKPEVSFQIPDWTTFQTHLKTQRYYAEKSMARLWNYIDGSVLNKMIYTAHYNQVVNGTQTVVDNGIISGSTSDGAGITPSVGNVAAIFSTAVQQLQKNNVMYVPNKHFTGKDNSGEKISSAAITPELYNALTMYIGGKNSTKGDEVTTNGYVGYFFGFNVHVSNNLPWSATLVLSTTPSDSDTFILGISSSVYQTFTFKSTLGSTAGNVKICSTAALTVTNLVNALNTPFTSIVEATNTGFAALVAGTYTAASTTTTYNGVMTQANAMTLFLKNLYAWQSTASSGTLRIQVTGFGPCYLAIGVNTGVAQTVSTTAKLMHCLFGTSQSIDMITQATPRMATNSVSSKIAKDFVTWTLFGSKVFNDQIPQLIDVQLLASNHIAPIFTIA